MVGIPVLVFTSTEMWNRYVGLRAERTAGEAKKLGGTWEELRRRSEARGNDSGGGGGIVNGGV
jgi:hypothetical protein